MSNFLQLTEIESWRHSDSNALMNNHTMTLEFALLDRKIEKKSTSLGLKVFFGILLLILETFGNYLLFCMVWYEKNGMDSKKRTITNQLLTRMVLALILFNISFMPLYFVGILIPLSEYLEELYNHLDYKFGYLHSIFKIICLNGNNFFFTFIDEYALDEYAYHITDCGLHRIITHILLTLSEMVIFKILYMYKFSIIVAMDEYFFTNIVTLLNGVINFGLTIIRILLGEQRRTRLYFQNFAKPNEFYTKLRWS